MEMLVWWTERASQLSTLLDNQVNPTLEKNETTLQSPRKKPREP